MVLLVTDCTRKLELYGPTIDNLEYLLKKVNSSSLRAALTLADIYTDLGDSDAVVKTLEPFSESPEANRLADQAKQSQEPCKL